MAVPSGWDAGSVSISTHSMTKDDDELRAQMRGNRLAELNAVSLTMAPSEFSEASAVPIFKDFIRTFVTPNNVYIYREQLMHNVALQKYVLEVDTKDLMAFDDDLTKFLLQYPAQALPWFEKGAALAIEEIETKKDGDNETMTPVAQRIQMQRKSPQILLNHNSVPISIRELNSTHVGRLVAVPGIVISAGRKQAKAAELMIRCKGCGHNLTIPSNTGFLSTSLPRDCKNTQKVDNAKCPGNPYSVVTESSVFIDHQTLKLQEAPEDIPTGEMPRHLMLSIEKESLVSRAPPGTRIIVVGIFSISQMARSRNQRNDSGPGSGSGALGIRAPFLQVVGLKLGDEGLGHGLSVFTRDEEREFTALARNPKVHDIIAENIAPAIFGHEDIKRAISCLLVGGSKKILPDGMRLRGDINVLLLGDPGTAKSQFLKFVEKVAPIGVYTSGKGSSAAGLTASVVRDSHSREFYLEGGAMVLADGGVVCIDEFDKMHTRDRVAIHEAMEQQTISIAKAGITTILNARSSVLAAANPVFGSFDDMRSPFENIEFQSTILSRFDMIFFVRDHRNEARDRVIASHIINNHMKIQTQKEGGDIDIQFLRKYIAYCRQRCAPRLSSAAADVLRNHYVIIRSQIKEASSGGNKSAIPITVRQLEAIIRISESLAKLSLSPVATEAHVNEAIRLFKVSTMEAAASGVVATEGVSPEMMAEVAAAEAAIKRKVPIGARTNFSKLIQDLKNEKISPAALNKAVQIMTTRDELKFQNQRKTIFRNR